MTIFALILVCIAIAFIFYFIGRALGDWIGKKQQMQDEVRRNGSKHR